MQGSLLLQLLILLVVANGTAVVAKKLLGVAFARPLDGGALFVDGQPVFGPSKTIRGIVVSVLATSICAVLMGLGWEVGTLVATFAMTGDRQLDRWKWCRVISGGQLKRTGTTDDPAPTDV